VHRSSRTLAGIVLAICVAVAFPASGAIWPDTSPASAIQIVLQTQSTKIRAVDNPQNWSLDTKERTWSVKRPVGPGVLDTTHTFIVIYKIDGATVASWQVDSRAGTAVAIP